MRRYRGLHALSILLAVGGFVAVLAVVQSYPGLLSREGRLPEGDREETGILIWLLLAGLAMAVGLVTNIARAIVVRAALPAHRYRGPSVVVLLLLAVVAANLISVPVATQVVDLLGGREVGPFGTLVILTATQLGLLGAATLFVLAPDALHGVSLLPRRGLWRSVAIGLGLSLPAWLGAQLLGYVAIRLLEPFGLEPESGLAEAALSNADPLVLVLALVLVAPVAEELFFRGVAFNAWQREYGLAPAMIGSAVLFGFIHGSVFLFVPIVALGLLLAGVYRWTGSLPAAIALHAGFNAITVALGMLVRFNLIDIPVT